MAGFRSILLLSFTYCVFAEGGQFFEPCYKNDIICLSNATESFLEKSSLGLPQYDIKPTDPLNIPELDTVVDDSMGLQFKFTNMTITGLRNLQVTDFKMDTDKRSVFLKTKSSLHIVSDLDIKFTNKDKTFKGPYTATATTVGTFEYGYSLTMKQNLEYFEVGPEAIACEVLGEPEVSIGGDLQNALDNDPDARLLKPGYEANKANLRKKTLCKIVEKAYVTIMHNLRASARTLPKTAFFKDI